MINNTYYSSAYYPNLNQNDWWRMTAWRTLATGKGNCYGYACAFAALAREIGYDPYVVCGRVREPEMEPEMALQDIAG